MVIETGKIFTNKTWRFLVPCLRGHGDEFVSKFNIIFKLAAGVHDTLLAGTKFVEDKNIYLLVDKTINTDGFYEFSEWIRKQEYYVTDYCPEPNILKAKQHMFVIAIPVPFHKAYEHFIKGEYSKMFSNKELKDLFSSFERRDDYQTLSRSVTARTKLITKVKTMFDTEISEEDLSNAEYELPLIREEEIFNNTDELTFINKNIEEKYEYNFN